MDPKADADTGVRKKTCCQAKLCGKKKRQFSDSTVYSYTKYNRLESIGEDQRVVKKIEI